jgi:hypothetical protein
MRAHAAGAGGLRMDSADDAVWLAYEERTFVVGRSPLVERLARLLSNPAEEAEDREAGYG